MWLNILQLKMGNIQVMFPNFQNHACYKKYMKNNKHNSLHLVQKYAWIFVHGHYLFLKAHSFSWVILFENCWLLGTDNVHAKWRLLLIYAGQLFSNSWKSVWFSIPHKLSSMLHNLILRQQLSHIVLFLCTIRTNFKVCLIPQLNFNFA